MHKKIVEPLQLNSGTYTGTYKLIGEEISLDFINTVSWPECEMQHDWLEGDGNFVKWALALKLIDKTVAKKLTQGSPSSEKKNIARVLAIRKDLTVAVKPIAFKKLPLSASLKKIETLATEFYKLRYIDLKTLKWKWKNPESLVDILAPVVANAIHVLTEVDHTRIKHCTSCNWIFYDNTRNRSRKWCDMSDCGSRDKALKYYYRNKA